jgi:hypothetical protein
LQEGGGRGGELGDIGEIFMRGHLEAQMAFSFGGPAEKHRERLQQGCSQTLRVSKEEGEEGMELEVVVRQLMERSFEASVREDAWSFADHALVETLVALMLARIQPLQVELCSEASLQRELHE